MPSSILSQHQTKTTATATPTAAPACPLSQAANGCCHRESNATRTWHAWTHDRRTIFTSGKSKWLRHDAPSTWSWIQTCNSNSASKRPSGNILSFSFVLEKY